MTREQIEVARKALMSYLWEECGGNHQPTEFYQTIDDHLDKIIAALRSAKDDDIPAREKAAILHCNPPLNTMSPESRKAVLEIAEAAQRRFAKDDEPSEAEIEAAAKAMVERAEMSWEHCAQTQWLGDASAALIAARKAREV